MRKLFKTVIISLIVVLIVPITINAEGKNIDEYFTRAQTAQAVASKLNKTTDITEDDLKTITDLNLNIPDGYDSFDDDLYQLSNLERLSIGYTKWTSLEGIDSVKNSLTHLQILNLPLNNIEALRDLENLESLVFSDQSPAMINALSNNNFFEPLENSNLKSLTTQYLPLNDEHLESVSKITSLNTLSIFGADITDSMPLSALVNLSYLNVSSTNIENLEGLRNLQYLKTLNIGASSSKDMITLSDFSALTYPKNSLNETMSVSVDELSPHIYLIYDEIQDNYYFDFSDILVPTPSNGYEKLQLDVYDLPLHGTYDAINKRMYFPKDYVLDAKGWFGFIPFPAGQYRLVSPDDSAYDFNGIMYIKAGGIKNETDITHKVIFDTNGGTAIAPKNIEHGVLIYPVDDPTKDNYIFKGWFKEATFINEWDFFSDTVEEDITLYAKWQYDGNTYNVTFDSMGGSPVAAQNDIIENGKVIKPIEPTRTGYVFTGWYRDDAYTQIWNFDSDKVTENLTLYAKWAPIKSKVTFDSKEGSNVLPIENVAYDSLISKPLNPVRDGYTFDAWYKDEAYTEEWDFNADTVIDNMTLYAKWDNKLSMVTFDSKGGSHVLALSNISYNSLITKPETPTKIGYAFDAWYKDESYTEKWDFTLDRVTDNMILYAKWDEVVSTVSFDSKDGSEISPIINVSYDSLISRPKNPTRVGYNFNAWYKDETYTEKWDFGVDRVVEDVVLYAKWDIILNTVSFESNGGSSVESLIDVEYGSIITKPIDPTRDEYRFEGWSQDPELNDLWNFEEDTVTSNLVLYAKWTKHEEPIKPEPPIVDPTKPTTPETSVNSDRVMFLNLMLIGLIVVLRNKKRVIHK